MLCLAIRAVLAILPLTVAFVPCVELGSPCDASRDCCPGKGRSKGSYCYGVTPADQVCAPLAARPRQRPVYPRNPEIRDRTDECPPGDRGRGFLFFVGLHRTGTHTQSIVAERMGIAARHDNYWYCEATCRTHCRESYCGLDRATGGRIASAFSDGGGHLWTNQSNFEFGAEASFDARYLSRCWPNSTLGLVVRPLLPWLRSKLAIMRKPCPLPKGATTVDTTTGNALQLVHLVAEWAIYREFYHRRILEYFNENPHIRFMIGDLTNDDLDGPSFVRKLYVAADGIPFRPQLKPYDDVSWDFLGQHHTRSEQRAPSGNETEKQRKNDRYQLDECYANITEAAAEWLGLDTAGRQAPILAFQEHQEFLGPFRRRAVGDPGRIPS